MSDHAAARRLFATSLDFTLDVADRDQLDEHLRDCPACRSYTASLRSDATILRDLDLGPVPIAVRADVAIAAERHDRGALGRWPAIVAVGALLVVTIGGGALGGGGQRTSSGDPGETADATANPQISWKTDVVALTAREFSIVVGGHTFRAVTPVVDVHSDPGNATYRTLETIWRENGVEMRLNLYFGGDAAASWVSEIRTYNGAAQGDWLYAKGVFFKAPIGTGWTGDEDITMTDIDGVGGAPAHVHFAGLTLINRPFDGINEPIGGGVALPENGRPFAPGGALHCSGILQMAPRDAERVLLRLGYRVSWRYITQNGGYWDARKDAPDGVIPDYDITVGSSSELIIPVIKFGEKDALPAPLPADCPMSGPVLVPLPVDSATP